MKLEIKDYCVRCGMCGTDIFVHLSTVSGGLIEDRNGQQPYKSISLGEII